MNQSVFGCFTSQFNVYWPKNSLFVHTSSEKVSFPANGKAVSPPFLGLFK